MGMYYSKCPNCKSIFWFNSVNFTKGGAHMPKCVQPRLVKYDIENNKAEVEMDPAIIAKFAEAMKDPNLLKKLKDVAKF